MNINLEYYKTFYYVAKNESISKAALELMTSQPNVSKTIKIFEEQINQTLFIRKRNGVSLTEAGYELFNKIKPAIELLLSTNNDLENLSKKESGTVNIGVNTVILHEYLIPRLKRFHDKYPNINYKFYNQKPSDLVNGVSNRLLDVIFLMMPINVSPELTVIKLYDFHNCLIASREYEYLKDKELTPNDIASLPLVLLKKNKTNRVLFDNYCYNNNVSVDPVVEFDNNYQIRDYTLSGLGIGLVYEEIIQTELKNGSLIKLKTSIPIDDTYLGIVYNSNNVKYIANLFIENIKKDY